MFTIIRRECLRLIERGRRSEHDHQAEPPTATRDAFDAIADKRRADLLAEALIALEPSHRDVILLRDIEELSAPEAATRLGISVEALKSRLHRARVELREQVLTRADSF
jgi:RNA polymerase sigma factor (sigma-70 family)